MIALDHPRTKPKEEKPFIYSASLLHFLVKHWVEIESRGDDVQHEWMLLDHDRGELCLCGTKWATSGAVVRSAPNQAVAWSPGSVRLDIRLAYSQLPMPWEGRTVVYLLTLDEPMTEQQITALRFAESRSGRPGEWTRLHRVRIAEEPFDWTSYPRMQDRLPETVSPWRFMAETLSGERSVLGRAA